MSEQSWEILDTGKADAAENMAIDVSLLDSLATHPRPILHLYDWNSPSATYGYFIDPFTLLCPQGLAAHGVQIARRPTGGGIIFHTTDFAFSMLVPSTHEGFSVNTLENYAFVNRMVIQAIEQLIEQKLALELLPKEEVPLDSSSKHFCMGKPTKYDVVIEGRKVGGGAQRRTKHGFLHQGTISLALPDESFLQEVLLPGTRVTEAMQRYTYSLMGLGAIEEGKNQLRKIFKSLLKSKAEG